MLGLPGVCDLCPLEQENETEGNEWMGQRGPSWGREQHREEAEADSCEKSVPSGWQ